MTMTNFFYYFSELFILQKYVFSTEFYGLLYADLRSSRSLDLGWPWPV